MDPRQISLDYLRGFALAGIVLVAHRLPLPVTIGLGLLSTLASAPFGVGVLGVPGFFLLGMGLGRTGALRSPGRYRAAYLVTFLATGAGAAALLAFVPAARGDAQWEAWPAAVGLVMAAAYLSGLLLLFPTAPGRALGRLLAPFGRMALTDYVTQTLVLVLLHLTVLPGLNDTWTAVLVGAGLVAVQIAASHWWLRRHDHGPLERAWRYVTYGQRSDEGRRPRPRFPEFEPVDREAMAHANHMASVASTGMRSGLTVS
jgi:uncharacterized protein